MTKEQIIKALKDAAKPYENYYIDDEVGQAMMQLPNPFELVEPILEIIGTNPTVHNIWMVHRCYNDINNPMRERFKALVMELKDDDSVPQEIKTEIDEFNW